MSGQTGCRKLRNGFKIEKFLVLAECFEQQTDCSRYRRKIANQGEVLCNRGGIFTFPYQANGNHATKPSTVGHVISERHWKSTFDFTEIVNNYGLKRGTVCQIVRFISQFSLKLYTQFWKYFHSMVLGSVGRGYCGKNRMLEFLVKIFG